MTFLLTGATGLVGVHVLIRLLGAGHHVVALVRAPSRPAADRRLRTILAAYPGFREELGNAAGLHAVPGDVTAPNCGLADQDIELLTGAVACVIHCAGHIAFTTDDVGVLHAVNVEGARNIALLAVRIGAPRLLHVSTAYVDSLLAGGGPRTVYEESKFAGERALAIALQGTPVDAVIVRPSIVTGDRRHGFTTTFHGIYPFFHFAALFVPQMTKNNFAALLRRAGFIKGRVNLVPADHVTDLVCELARRSALPARVFNIVAPVDWRIEELVRIAGGQYGREPGIPVAPGAANAADGGLSPALAQWVDRLERVYGPYFNITLRLDTASTEALMKETGMPIVRNTSDWIGALFRWGALRNWETLG